MRETIERAAFEIVDNVSGHRWKIYADGQVSGFGDNVRVINRIPMLMTTAAVEAQIAIQSIPEQGQ